VQGTALLGNKTSTSPIPALRLLVVTPSERALVQRRPLLAKSVDHHVFKFSLTTYRDGIHSDLVKKNITGPGVVNQYRQLTFGNLRNLLQSAVEPICTSAILNLAPSR
jgi:hypothetical protein